MSNPSLEYLFLTFLSLLSYKDASITFRLILIIDTLCKAKKCLDYSSKGIFSQSKRNLY